MYLYIELSIDVCSGQKDNDKILMYANRATLTCKRLRESIKVEELIDPYK
jgi:hypothetical protein